MSQIQYVPDNIPSLIAQRLKKSQHCISDVIKVEVPRVSPDPGDDDGRVHCVVVLSEHFHPSHEQLHVIQTGAVFTGSYHWVVARGELAANQLDTETGEDEHEDDEQDGDLQGLL